MNFTKLNIDQKIIENVTNIGYQTLTKIQEKIIPLLLTENCDVFACAQTGTGKTAAYALPIINRIIETRKAPGKRLRCLIIAPTRELAIQIHDNFVHYSQDLKIDIGLYYGGIKLSKQLNQNKKENDIIIATPGRLLDLQNQGFVNLRSFEILVLDEADHMLDLGFINEINKILALLARHRQTLLFSATLSKEVKAIANLIMTNPRFVSVDAPNSANYMIKQFAWQVKPKNRLPSLICTVEKFQNDKILIFTQTKKEANFLGIIFKRLNINSNVIHSDKKQQLRQHILEKFKANAFNVLIATDVISRGLHINQVDLVINYQIPKNPESYVHRIGRTGRAGKNGQSITFYGKDELRQLLYIEKLMETQIDKSSSLFTEDELNKKRIILSEIIRQRNNNQVNKFKTNKNKKTPNWQAIQNKQHRPHVRFPFHNHLKSNMKKQHQIHASFKKNNTDTW